MGRKRDVDIFLEALASRGGRVSNAQLIKDLRWDEGRYWRVHGELYDEGAIEKGRGYSGTVIRVLQNEQPNLAGGADRRDADPLGQSPVATEVPREDNLSEIDLYDPAREQIEKNWPLRFGFDQWIVEKVALQGARQTGGNWTRPDIALIGIKRFEYIPQKILDIYTIEVKPSYDVTVKAVMEALTHRESDTHSFVLFYTAGRSFDDYPEALRIQNLAARHGIGIFAAKSIRTYDDWTEIVPAKRASPEPEDVERFIKSSLSPGSRAAILKWK